VGESKIYDTSAIIELARRSPGGHPMYR